MLNRIKKHLAVLLVGVIFLLQMLSEMIVYADESTTGDEVTISVASNISKQDMQTYIDAFYKKYPNIKIEYSCYSDYENEVGKQLEDGTYADVLFIPGFVNTKDYTSYFSPLGKRMDLEKKYAYLEGSKLSGDMVYGIPSSAYVTGMIYNKEVFEKAGISETPKTIDEFMEDLYMIKERTDAIPFYTNCSDGWTLYFWEQYPFLAMTGDPDYRENGFVNEINPFLEGTTHYQVYKLLYDIVDKDLCEPDPLQSNWDKSKSMINNGQIGCMVIGSWAIKQIKDAGSNKDAIGYMPFPNMINGKQYMTISADYCYGINKNCKDIDAARKYIDFMLDESGYALDREVLSLVKTDPVVESYGNMDNVICLCNNEASEENYKKRLQLSKNLSILDNTDEIQRVIEAALGNREETFDDIIRDWNERWESSRTEDMTYGNSNRKIVLNSELTQNEVIEFSETEQEYIDNLQEIRVGYLNNKAPYQYYFEREYHGFLKSIVQIVSENLNIPITEKGYDNTEELVKALQNNDIDMAAGIDRNTKYNYDLKFSTKIIDVLKVMVRNNSISANDALNGTMVQIDGEDYSYLQTGASCIIKEDKLIDCLDDIEKLKADFTVSDYHSVNFYVHEQYYEHLECILLSESEGLYFSYNKNCDTRLISICNKILYSISDDNKQILLNESLQTENKKITVKRFIETNTIPCLIFVSMFFGIIILFIIIVAKQRAEMARMDALTGVNNRYGIRMHVNKLIEKKNYPMYVAILDLDNFKSVNDTLGHLGGDEALRILANTMKAVFGKKVVLGRYGGDEFVIAYYSKDRESVEASFRELVTRMDRELTFDGATVHLSISVGVAEIVKEMPYDNIFNAADEVLYNVKKQGKNNYGIVSYPIK